MASPNDDLLAKLNTPSTTSPSFTVPDTTEPTKEEEVTPQENLIKMAEERNTKINEKKVFDKTPVKPSELISAKVKQVLKDNGMDSQQVEKAHAQLMSIIWGN